MTGSDLQSTAENTAGGQDQILEFPLGSGREPFRLDTLAEMANDLAGHFSLEPLLERILRHTMRLLGCDSGSICTVNEVAGTYRKEVDLGVGCRSGQTFSLDEGVTGEVVRARRAVVFTKYSDITRGHIPKGQRESLHGVIGVPIRWNGTIIGTCVIFSRDPERRFNSADAAIVELFATHAAIAITNARLHEIAAERDREAATIAERERVVRDVHDTVGRGLATVMLHLDDAEREVAAKSNPSRALAKARQSANSALTETRRTFLGLGPALLDGRSLSEAIALELAWLRSTTTLSTHLVTIGEPQPLPSETMRQLFRILQEALTNVIEHAQARSVRIGLVYSSETISVLVEDDGRGFDTSLFGQRAASLRESRGLGLRGLVERARHLGGTVHVDSTPGWGTRLKAELPIAGPWIDDGSESRWRVLVVHDSPLARAGLVRMLSLVEPDIQVVGEIGEADQAVDAYELLRPDVVLAHLQLPHIDGVRLTSYLRASDPDAAVVLIVDSVSDDRVRDAAQGGAVGFVTHDVDPGGLARAIVAAARGDSLMTAELFSHFSAIPSPDLDGGEPLTMREREVRALVESGLPDKKIAAEMQISVRTVEKHVGSILRKTGAPNRTSLAIKSALRN
jgi:signal transduction histidine kinase/DNA-binding NarL/FixJ family response regulator